MKSLTLSILAVLLALVAGLLIAQHVSQHNTLAGWSVFAFFVVGTVTTTYQYPVSGTTPPTAAQMLNLSALTAVLNWGDTDTSATITHNMGLTTGQLNNLFPIVSIYATALNGSPSAPAPFVSALGANTITVTKSSVTNSGGTFNVTIFRPNSIMT